MVIDVDDQFTDYAAVAEGHHARTVLQFGIDDETRHQASMQGADVSDGVPHVLGRRIDRYFAANGRHRYFSSLRQTAIGSNIVVSRLMETPC
jgi:hypothetical protein